MNKMILPVLLGIAIVLLSIVTGIGMKWRDRKAPEISIPEEEIVYNEGDPTEQLLRGVSAYDDRDGDVSDTLLVYSIIPLEAEGAAKVIYAARDRSNNIVTADRRVTYRRTMLEAIAPDAASPLIKLNTYGTTLKKGETFDPFLYISTLKDDKDSAEELRRRLSIAGSYDLTKSGRYKLVFTVSDSDGNVSNKAEFLLLIE